MKRLSPARFLNGSWTSLGYTAGFMACFGLGLSLAIVSYVDARADGRELYAGPAPVIGNEGAPWFPLHPEALREQSREPQVDSLPAGEPCPTLSATEVAVAQERLEQGRTAQGGVPLVPIVVRAQSDVVTLEEPCDLQPEKVLHASDAGASGAQEPTARPTARITVRANTKASTRSVASQKRPAKSSRATRSRSDRRRRVSLQGAVVGVQIGTAVKTTSRSTPISPVRHDRPTNVKGPKKGHAKSGIGMN